MVVVTGASPSGCRPGAMQPVPTRLQQLSPRGPFTSTASSPLRGHWNLCSSPLVPFINCARRPRAGRQQSWGLNPGPWAVLLGSVSEAAVLLQPWDRWEPCPQLPSDSMTLNGFWGTAEGPSGADAGQCAHGPFLGAPALAHRAWSREVGARLHQLQGCLLSECSPGHTVTSGPAGLRKSGWGPVPARSWGRPLRQVRAVLGPASATCTSRMRHRSPTAE